MIIYWPLGQQNQGEWIKTQTITDGVGGVEVWQRDLLTTYIVRVNREVSSEENILAMISCAPIERDLAMEMCLKVLRLYNTRNSLLELLREQSKNCSASIATFCNNLRNNTTFQNSHPNGRWEENQCAYLVVKKFAGEMEKRYNLRAVYNALIQSVETEDWSPQMIEQLREIIQTGEDHQVNQVKKTPHESRERVMTEILSEIHEDEEGADE